MTIKIRIITFESIMNKIGNICLYAFLMLTTYIFLYRYDHTFFIIRYIFLITGAIIGFVKCFIDMQKFQSILVFTMGGIILWTLTYLVQNNYNNYPPADFLYTICYIGIAILILENKYSHLVSLGLYAFTSLSILIRVIQGVNKNLILLANSRNYISILLMSTMLLYYISCHDKKKPVLITPVVVFFYINIYATGRSGIIVSGFLAIALIVYKYLSIKKKQLKILMFFLAVIISITVIIYIFQLEDSVISSFLNKNFSAFLDRGTDSNGREKIWTTFIENNTSGIWQFLFGSDASLAMMDGNLHNSFLQSYASFGVIGFVALIILIVRALIAGIRNKDYLWLILFIGLLLRALTDRVFYQGYCEVYLYYFLFYYTYWKKNKKLIGEENGY